MVQSRIQSAHIVQNESQAKSVKTVLGIFFKPVSDNAYYRNKQKRETDENYKLEEPYGSCLIWHLNFKL